MGKWEIEKWEHSGKLEKWVKWGNREMDETGKQRNGRLEK